MREQQTFAQHHGANLGGYRPDRHADRDLLGSLDHRLTDRRIDAERRKRQGHRGQHGQRRRAEAPRRRGLPHQALHPGHAFHERGGVEPPGLGANRRGQGRRVGGCRPHHQMLDPQVALRICQVKIEPRIGQAPIATVAHHAHDRRPPPLRLDIGQRPRRIQPLADWILARPEAPRQRFAHHGDARSRGGIAFRKAAAAHHDERQSLRSNPVWPTRGSRAGSSPSHPLPPPCVALRSGRCRPSRCPNTRAAAGRRRRRLHTGHRPDALEQRRVEAVMARTWWRPATARPSSARARDRSRRRCAAG